MEKVCFSTDILSLQHMPELNPVSPREGAAGSAVRRWMLDALPPLPRKSQVQGLHIWQRGRGTAIITARLPEGLLPQRQSVNDCPGLGVEEMRRGC